MVGKRSNSFKLDNPDGFNSLEARARSGLEPSSSIEAEIPNPLPSPVSRRGIKLGKWLWLLIGLSICSVFGGVGGLAFWWILTPPPTVDCKTISSLSTDMDRLYCAQQAARSGEIPKILAGLELASQWTPDRPLYPEAQRLIAEWSDPILLASRKKIEQSDLRGAIELASRIPPSSPLYKEAQAEIAHWKKYWRQGEAITTAARTAMRNQNWLLAEEKIGDLKGFNQDYWRFDQVRALSQLLSAEKQGRRILMEAQQIARTGQPDQLGAAIAQVSKMDKKTFAWADTQPLLKQWSETLLALGYQNWVKGNLTEANRMATLVSPNPNLAQTAQELLWLSQARQHALGSNTTMKPTLPQIWNLTAAIATAALIKPESRFYQQAQTALKDWQAQLQDLTLLQSAWIVGEVPTVFTKQLAQLQAHQIGRDRPRRAQAQTLIAYWTTEAQKIEDRPYLIYARKVAEKGTISALQAAIAQAGQIGLKRPLRLEAQTLIGEWTYKIQAIEDQPILDRASVTANQGNLSGAIQIAATVAPGRALYGQAQSLIGGWQAQIRAAELARQRAEQEALKRRMVPEELREPVPTNNEGYPGNGSNSAQPYPEQSYPESSPAPEPPPASPSPAASEGHHSPASPTPFPSPSVVIPSPYEPVPPSGRGSSPGYAPYEPAPPPQ
jgi:hypothetical protein